MTCDVVTLRPVDMRDIIEALRFRVVHHDMTPLINRFAYAELMAFLQNMANHALADFYEIKVRRR